MAGENKSAGFNAIDHISLLLLQDGMNIESIVMVVEGEQKLENEQDPRKRRHIRRIIQVWRGEVNTEVKLTNSGMLEAESSASGFQRGYHHPYL